MVKIVTDYKEALGFTHSGTMHADEVFATAFLDLLFEDFKVIRVNELPNYIPSKAIVYDIGKGNFDHHQADAKIRDNGIKYSSFGLLFEEYGKLYLKKINVTEIDSVYDYFVKDFILAIDAIDNGEFPVIKASYKVKTITDVIKLFNPSYSFKEDENQNFVAAVELAKVIFNYELKSVIGKVKAFKKVKEKLPKVENGILILDCYLPYEEVILNSLEGKKVKLVLYPSNRGGFAVKTVPISLTNSNSRIYFPKAWAGLNDEELEKISKVEGASFCHVNRFLVTAKTKEAALKLALLAVKANEKC